MSSGRSRTSNKVMGRVVTIDGYYEFVKGEDGRTRQDFSVGTFEAGKSWEELLEEANEGNNYLNSEDLANLTPPFGAYTMNSDNVLKNTYFDENSLYMVNEIANAYRIQARITNNNPDFMFTTDSSRGIDYQKSQSLIRIAIDKTTEPIKQAFSNKGTLAYINTDDGKITLNRYLLKISPEKGVGVVGVYDMRIPNHAKEGSVTSFKSGWSSTSSYVGSILHEYGHAIQSIIGKNPKYRAAYDKFLVETTLGINALVSKYPASFKKNFFKVQTENFAEAYAAYATGTKVKASAKAYYEPFKALMKEIGIQEGSL